MQQNIFVLTNIFKPIGLILFRMLKFKIILTINLDLQESSGPKSIFIFSD